MLLSVRTVNICLALTSYLNTVPTTATLLNKQMMSWRYGRKSKVSRRTVKKTEV